MIWFLVGTVLLPSLALIAWLLYHREHRILLMQALVCGAFLALLALLMESPLGRWLIQPNQNLFATAALRAWGISALVEEGLKALCIAVFFYSRKEFLLPGIPIRIAVVLALGLAVMENLLFSLDEDFFQMLLRGLSALPLHLGATGLLGWFWGRARRNLSCAGLLKLAGILAAISIHGLYNFLIFIRPVFSAGGILSAVLAWGTVLLVGRLFRGELRKGKDRFTVRSERR